MPTKQGDMQVFFRAINGSASDYNSDFLDAAASEGFTGEFNGVFIQWLQNRTGSSSTNLDGLKQEFATLAGAHNWQSTGGVPIVLEGNALWLDADDDRTITSSGDLVSLWDDKSGDGNSATQVTGSERPTTEATTLNNKNVLDFDGSNSLELPSGVFSIPNGPNTIFAVAKRNVEDATGQIILAMTESGGAGYHLRYEGASGQVGFLSRDQGAGTLINSGNTNTNFQILTAFRTGTTLSLSVNGGTASTNTNGADESGIDASTIGVFGASSLRLTGSIAEIILYNRALSTAEISAIENYLSVEWAITLS